MILLLIVSVRGNADGILLGDLNNDERMTVADIAILINQLKEGKSPTQNCQSSDLNQDSRLDSTDLHRLANIITRQRSTNADTLYLYFHNDDVCILNPFPSDEVRVVVPQGTADVFITGRSCSGMAISARGESSNGRLYVDSDKDYVLNLQGLTLESQNGPAFNSVSDKKVKVELADNIQNTFVDAKKYSLSESESANGCFNSMGQFTFKGNGSIQVTGNNKHAIYCKKSINIDGGTILVEKAKSDALHSGKHININGGELTLKGMDGDAIDLDDDFTMTGGSLTMDITGEAAKGVKCGGIMTITDGTITATASGALKNKNGELGYCTILKCDSCVVITGGMFQLTNSSPGGKCISVDQNLTIEGGTFTLETSGDGAEYTNVDGEKNYYTSKCVAVDDSLFLHRGTVKCLSTGIGGKGLVAEKYMEIGKRSDTAIEQGPTINVETTNSSIVNDVDEDQRYGCPKAIKASEYLNIFSGDIHCTTAGMGGEGIECGKEMTVYNCNLECNCYDDGINVGESIVVNGGQIYCNSADNDGIDSNGSITINGGLVASVNQKRPNESFDSENAQFYINGGTVFGIGSAAVRIGNSTISYYNTVKNYDSDKGPVSFGLELVTGKYVSIMKDDEILLSLYNDNRASKKYVTFASQFMEPYDIYSLYEGTKPISPEKQYFGGKLIVGGQLPDSNVVIDFIQFRKDKN